MAGNEVKLIVTARNMMARGLKSAQAQIKRFTKAAKAAFIGLAATGASILGIGKYFSDAASDAEETISKYDTVFSSIRGQASLTAKSLAKDFGLASSTSKQLLGDTGDLLVGFGFTEDSALDLSDKVNRLAIDLASFTNYSGGAKGASEALTKMLLGETESAKSLGIVVRQNTKEYRDRVAAVQADQGVTIQQAKALVNLQIAMEQSTKAQGDYARTSKNLANVKRRLSESFKEFREQTGKVINESTGLAGILDKLATKIQGVTKRIGEWADAGGVERLIKNVKELGQTFARQKVNVMVGVITVAVIKLSTKIYLLGKRFEILNAHMTANKAASLLAAAKMKLLGLEAGKATGKVIALKASMLALKGAGIGAIAVGFAAIAKYALDAREAANKLAKSMERLKGTEQGAVEKFGAKSGALRKIRLAIQNDDVESLEKLRRLYPEAVANAEKLLKVQKQETDQINEGANAVKAKTVAEIAATANIAKAKADAAKKEKEAEEKAAKTKEQNLKKLANINKQIQDAEQKRQDFFMGQQANAWQQQVANNQRVAGLRVKAFLDEKRQQEEKQKQLDVEAKRRKELVGRQRRGVKLSKKDREFLEAQNAIAAAQNQVKVAKNNLAQIDKENQEKQLKNLEKIEGHLDKQRKELKQLLAMG